MEMPVSQLIKYCIFSSFFSTPVIPKSTGFAFAFSLQISVLNNFRFSFLSNQLLFRAESENSIQVRLLTCWQDAAAPLIALGYGWNVVISFLWNWKASFKRLAQCTSLTARALMSAVKGCCLVRAWRWIHWMWRKHSQIFIGTLSPEQCSGVKCHWRCDVFESLSGLAGSTGVLGVGYHYHLKGFETFLLFRFCCNSTNAAFRLL